MRKITVAIDGYSSCGKSTMARQLAKTIGYTYVDTGAMYRAVTLFALRRNYLKEGRVDLKKLISSLENINIKFDVNGNTLLNDEVVEAEIRSMLVSKHVSYVSAIPEVREHLVSLQKLMGLDGGVVMDGRDIGTVVFPNAELKIFVTADAEVRAKRRFDELKSKGQEADYNEILENVKERDRLDETRVVSPLKKADDAIVLDNSNMTISEQNAWVMDKFNEACRNSISR